VRVIDPENVWGQEFPVRNVRPALLGVRLTEAVN
jgi:hypothetical protein